MSTKKDHETENLSSVQNEKLSTEERELGYSKDDNGLTNVFANEPETYVAGSEEDRKK